MSSSAVPSPSVALRVGISLMIKRSNGRVHSAVVSGIDTSKRCVSVEWFEDNETKGKEIDIDQILQLNPKLVLHPIESHAGLQSRLQSDRRKTSVSPMHSGIPRPTARLRNVENIVSSTKAVPADSIIKPVVNNAPANSAGSSVAKQSRLRSIGTKETRPAPLVRACARKAQSAAQPPGKGLVQATVQGAPLKSLSSQSLPSMKPPAPCTEVKDKAPSEGVSSSSVAANRKQKCVKEVDKIKKRREERRVKQAELKQEKDKYFDPDNPNWEFLKMVTEYRAGLNITSISGTEPVINDQICVCLRKRPLSKREMSQKDLDIITIPDGSLTLVHEPKLKLDLTKYMDLQKFWFDFSFDEAASNELVFKYSAQPLVNSVFERGMATCFAYGQTGSGKTHTMGGALKGKEQDTSRGIYALAAGEVFKLNNSPTHRPKGLVISASFFEIYCSKVFDLLNEKKRLKILEDRQGKVQVVGLQESSVSSVANVLALLRAGNAYRTSGTTSANQNSSRSHAVFQIILRKKSSGKLHGKLSLIDLAGNERGVDTSSSDRLTRREGAEINKSLLALKECIRALGRKNAHLPFRGSTLTQVLRDSFVGSNARTCMIATISPGLSCCEHTLNTLRYAARTKDLTNKAHSRFMGGEGPEPTTEATPAPDDNHQLEQVEEEDGEDAVVQSVLEKSAELQTFHDALHQVQAIEEQIIDRHKALLEEGKESVSLEEQLLHALEGVDGDPEVYVDSLKKLLDARLVRMQEFRGMLDEYSKRLNDEEMASRQVHRLQPPV